MIRISLEVTVPVDEPSRFIALYTIRTFWLFVILFVYEGSTSLLKLVFALITWTVDFPSVFTVQLERLSNSPPSTKPAPLVRFE